MKRVFLIIVSVLIVLLSILLVSSCLAALMSGSSWMHEKGDVAVVKLTGDIFDPYPLLELLEKLEERDDVKAVVLRIDSPGGTVSASEEIYLALKRLKQKKKLVASLGTVAASGGYYVACAAEKIIANRGTITGSIGVRLEHVNVGELFQWARIEPKTLKAGRYKDLASPYRPLGAEEEQILQSVLEEMHGQFKAVVREGRGLDQATVDALADGRIFTGEKALDLKLVDQLGSLRDAIDTAAKLAEIKGRPEVIYPKPESEHWLRYLIDTLVGEITTVLTHRPAVSWALWHL